MNQGPLQHFESGWAIEKKKSVGRSARNFGTVNLCNLFI